MKRTILITLCLTLLALPVAAQKSPANMVAAYDALADSILGMRAAEASFVRAILENHYRGALRAKDQGEWEKAAAEMALFASEGDNAVAGIRKRLIEGGHFFNDGNETDSTFEKGFVIVTRKAKKNLLEASAAMRSAEDKDARMAAWYKFQPIAEKHLKK